MKPEFEFDPDPIAFDEFINGMEELDYQDSEGVNENYVRVREEGVSQLINSKRYIDEAQSKDIAIAIMAAIIEAPNVDTAKYIYEMYLPAVSSERGRDLLKRSLLRAVEIAYHYVSSQKLVSLKRQQELEDLMSSINVKDEDGSKE